MTQELNLKTKYNMKKEWKNKINKENNQHMTLKLKPF